MSSRKALDFGPDEPFHNFGAFKSLAQHKICRSADIEALKLRKGSPGPMSVLYGFIDLILDY